MLGLDVDEEVLMAVDLIDYIDALKREVQPPGSNLFVGVTNDVWVGYLTDAFWEARLDGFLDQWIATENSPTDVTIEPTDLGGDDIPRQFVALIVLYAGIRVLRNRILNTNTGFRAKAGPVEFEQQNSANLLSEMLKQLKATKDRIIESLEQQQVSNLPGGGVLLLDAFSARLFTPGYYFGDPGLMGV